MLYKWDASKTDFVPKNPTAFKDITGQRFGKAIALYPIRKGPKQIYWICKCDCGLEFGGWIGNLRRGKVCQCGKAKKNEHNPAWAGFEEMHGRFLSSIKRNADSRNIEYNVNFQYIWDLFLKQNRKCALSGMPLIMGNKDNNTASLDRIDSSKGYIEGNVQWTHKHVNRMKSNHTDKYFIELCTTISNYNKVC